MLPVNPGGHATYQMYPFEAGALLLENQAALLPVQEICDRLGADMAWDGSTLTIQYRGSTVQLTDKSGTYLKDDKTAAYQMLKSSVICVYGDKLFVTSNALEESLCIGAHDMENPGEWYIVP